MSAQKQTTKNLTISLYHGKKTAKIKRGFDRLSVILKFNATCAAQRNATQGNVKNTCYLKNVNTPYSWLK